jgi:predicted permease
MNPPGIARLLLRLLLPKADRRVLIGDLDEELRRDIAPARGAVAARLWYWRQVLSSVPYAVQLRVLPALTTIPADARYALRLWRRQPVFALAAISTQAIGIAVTTAVMAIAYAVLLRPLPYADADRLVQINELTGRSGLFSYPDFLDLRRANRSFDVVAGFNGGSMTLALPGVAPERVVSAEVSDGFFELLGVRPVAGRTIAAADVRRGAPRVVVISHNAWMRRFGGDSSMLERSILLNGQPHTVVGILPPQFEFPLRGLAELWLPMRPSPQQEARGYWHWMDVLGRRRIEVTEAQAASDLQSVASLFAARDPKWHSDIRLEMSPLRDVIVGRVRPTIRALMAAVVLVVVATCATIAGLLLSRASSRTRELSVRAAIGAGRSRLVAQLLTENLLLSLAGGAAGVLGGQWLVTTFVATMPDNRRAALPHFDDVGVGLMVGGAAFALSLATGLLFGVIPAWRASRGDAGASLKAVRATHGKGESRVRFALVGLQVAVALVLLSSASLLGISMYRLLNVSPGFDPAGLVTMRVTLPSTYRDAPAVNAFQDRLRERLEAIPGVTAVAAISQPPLTGRGDTGTAVIVERPLPPGQRGPDVALRTVSANYFSAIGIPVIRGRTLADTDTAGTPQVVVVNQWLAERVLAGSDPIGQHLTFEFAKGRFEIVGIVGDEQFDDIDRPLLPVVYFPARQDALTDPTLMVRTTQPASLPAAARAALAEIDPAIPLFAVRTVEQIRQQSAGIFIRRTAMWQLGIFAAAAVMLAAMGLYGVLAQAVSERTREIGVRVALGATRTRILRVVLHRGLGATLAGLAVGVAGSAVASRLLTSLMFGVQPGDPMTLAVSAALLAVVAVLACIVPALRAIRVDPASAVRD